MRTQGQGTGLEFFKKNINEPNSFLNFFAGKILGENSLKFRF